MNLGTLIVVIVIGIAAGALSGLVGIGGGIVIVPLLVMFLGFSQQTAQGTTLAMLSFPVSFVGAYTYWQKGMVDWKIAILLCLGFVVGGYFGSKYAVSVSPYLLKKIFAVLLIVIAVKFFF
ncbi:MAG: sulfite exporter TauE/SafE family protein [Bacteroidetes bacterium]|nr:sulfite exporter TauE/SafE family protein [Bacteroidota bacterium]